MNKIIPFGSLAIAIVAIVIGVTCTGGETVREIERANVGAITGPDVYSYMNVYGALGYREKIISIAPTSQYSTTTLAVENSGTNYMLSASGTTMTLPPVTTEGTVLTFTVNGALDTANVIIDSYEGDNIDGTLIVAGAVVDCRGEDQINFVVDGEADGDTVTLISDGTQWLIKDSNVLTAAKMTCTDPS